MENFFWTGYSSSPRHDAINEIQKIVLKYGDVIDFKFFSDLSITLVIEVKELNLDNLYDELCSFISLDKVELSNSNSQKERMIYLNVSFGKGTGDLQIEVPSVPG